MITGLPAHAFDDAAGRTLLAVMPHPDDESYSVAGTLAMAAAGGSRVELLCATRGEAGWVRDRARYGQRDLAELRTEELERSCQVLGLPPPRFLDWPDDGVEAAADVGVLAAQLGGRSPDVILTLARDGVYGHRDHVAVTETLLAAAATETPQARVLLADFPPGLFASLSQRIRRRAPAVMRDDVDPSALGSPRCSLIVDLPEPVAALKRASIASHASQITRTDPLEFLFPGLIEAVCAAERFQLASGPPLPSGARSPFAGLRAP